jgi:3-isopropylmalate/(R)-2-methylmalate dehydratase small subunit
MDPFTSLTGAAAPLDRINVDTDQITPKQYLKSIGRTGFGKFLFADWRYQDGDLKRPRPDFVLNQPRYRDAKILVTRDNFGCGSSREHAAWALTDFGIRCVIASSFGDIFYNNSLKNGLLPAIVEDSEAERLIREIESHPGLQVKVDLREQVISTDSGFSVRFRVSPEAKRKLLEGLDDISQTLLHEREITDFEQRRKRAQPWL